MLSQVNYRVPNMRFLRERLTVGASQVMCRWGGGGREPLAGEADQRSSLCTLQDLEQRSSDITYGQFAQLYRSLMYNAQKTVHEPPAPSTALVPAPPAPPTPALLVSALMLCLGIFGCHFSSSSPLDNYPHLLPQPSFLRAPSPCGLPGALALTRFCLLQMDLPFLEASALRFGLDWDGGALPG